MVRSALAATPPAQPLQAPRTPLNGALTSDRVFACAGIDLATAKAVKDAFGVKLNDVVLAVSSGALRRYLDEQGELPERPLVAQVPVSIRDETSQDHVGTKVAAMFCSLATDIDDPASRLRAIHASSTSGKAQRTKLTHQTEVNLTETTPPAAIAIASRLWSLGRLDGRIPPIFNLIISNVPGPPFDLYVAGARIEALYPMGPLLYGSGVNFTVVSTKDRLDFGLMACPAIVPDPWAIADQIEPALEELVSAAG
jgi:WS/DGAT/MGAT family acyltransferase